MIRGMRCSVFATAQKTQSGNDVVRGSNPLEELNAIITTGLQQGHDRYVLEFTPQAITAKNGSMGHIIELRTYKQKPRVETTQA